MSSLRLFVACAPGLEPLLAAEMSPLAAEVERVAGGVVARGDVDTVYRLNLELGLASHVLVRLADFEARTFGQLVHHTAEVPWREWLTPDVPLRLRATARSSRLFHTGAIEERVRLGIERRLDTTLRPPAPGEAHQVVQARLADDRCVLSLDTSGEPLHRRGYRLAGGKAPLREDLARALVCVSGWDSREPPGRSADGCRHDPD